MTPPRGGGAAPAVLPRDVVAGLTTLLCDADGNLFPSEEPAFAASAKVTNRLMADLGSERRFEGEELRLATTGMNFRSTARNLADDEGISLADEDVEHWVLQEKEHVTAHLARALTPDEQVTAPLRRLAEDFHLAVVTSSALTRLAACLDATELEDLFPETVRFSAEDSLPRPAGKPDPAIYRFACDQLGASDSAVAIEDSIPGVQSAVAAGVPVIGNLVYVAPDERAERSEALSAAGAVAVVSSWHEVERLLSDAGPIEQAGQSLAGP